MNETFVDSYKAMSPPPRTTINSQVFRYNPNPKTNPSATVADSIHSTNKIQLRSVWTGTAPDLNRLQDLVTVMNRLIVHATHFIKRAGYDVYLVDEHLTSSVCFVSHLRTSKLST